MAAAIHLAKSYLIDVRTAQEYSTGFLPGALNIEYQNIVPFITKEQAPKDSHITLYCRSGRRSAIAKEELDAIGYEHVRDLGSIEMAREVLKAKDAARAHSGGEDVEGEKVVNTEELRHSTAKLLEGLRGID